MNLLLDIYLLDSQLSSPFSFSDPYWATLATTPVTTGVVARVAATTTVTISTN